MLPRQWTPAIPLAELTANPMPVEIAGEHLVVFRDQSDRWHALLDRCPHRGATLSLGSVTDDGALQCRYHGWRFSGGGACVRVPLNELNEKALGRISATAVPTRELAGALWIWTGTETPPETVPEPTLPPSLQGPPRQFGTYSQFWTAHWTRAAENFIDFAHPPYLHRDTIGSWTHAYAESGATAHVDVHPMDWGFTTLNYFGSRSHGFRLDWYRPGLSVLHFGGSDEGKLHVFSIPVNATRTRVMTVRKLPAGYDEATWSARAANVDHSILDEDRVVVESQPPGPVSDDREVSVATDAPTVAFRRWYYGLMGGT